MKNLREIAKQHSAVFVGPVRNCAPFLDEVFKNIERIGSLFKSYSVVFVESDSEDNSLEILQEYKKDKDNIHVVTLGDIRQEVISRTIRIGVNRNVGLKFCEDNGLLDTHDFYFQLCVDDVFGKEINLDGILSCFKYELDTWDVMTANQNTYYDLWTLRCKGWLDYDCWYELDRNRPPYMSRDEAYNILIGSRHIKIPRKYGLIEVDAAHGGLSIYKSSIIKGCRYRGYNESNMFEESDIISVCEQVKEKGGKIFINSEMINIEDN